MAVCTFVSCTGSASHVLSPEVKGPFWGPWLFTRRISACVWVALADPDVVQLLVSDKVLGLLVAICPPPVVTWLAASVFEPTDPTLFVTGLVPTPSTVEAMAALTGGG
jgi:hypothetical protein